MFTSLNACSKRETKQVLPSPPTQANVVWLQHEGFVYWLDRSNSSRAANMVWCTSLCSCCACYWSMDANPLETYSVQLVIYLEQLLSVHVQCPKRKISSNRNPLKTLRCIPVHVHITMSVTASKLQMPISLVSCAWINVGLSFPKGGSSVMQMTAIRDMGKALKRGTTCLCIWSIERGTWLPFVL